MLHLTRSSTAQPRPPADVKLRLSRSFAGLRPACAAGGVASTKVLKNDEDRQTVRKPRPCGGKAKHQFVRFQPLSRLRADAAALEVKPGTRSLWRGDAARPARAANYRAADRPQRRKRSTCQSAPLAAEQATLGSGKFQGVAAARLAMAWREARASVARVSDGGSQGRCRQLRKPCLELDARCCHAWRLGIKLRAMHQKNVCITHAFTHVRDTSCVAVKAKQRELAAAAQKV